ncbi:MAG: hypothetical protein HY907_06670 [Deltaproteobacteria bacterium]|nr:hypothetical protein [Deltaproteobacteria bacterium]
MTKWWTRNAKRAWRTAPEDLLRGILEASRRASPVMVTAAMGNLPGNGPMLHCFPAMTPGWTLERRA